MPDVLDPTLACTITNQQHHPQRTTITLQDTNGQTHIAEFPPLPAGHHRFRLTKRQATGTHTVECLIHAYAVQSLGENT